MGAEAVAEGGVVRWGVLVGRGSVRIIVVLGLFSWRWGLDMVVWGVRLGFGRALSKIPSDGAAVIFVAGYKLRAVL